MSLHHSNRRISCGLLALRLSDTTVDVTTGTPVLDAATSMGLLQAEELCEERIARIQGSQLGCCHRDDEYQEASAVAI